jgi:GPH family glycoside/pentoside/hexuronide:cation symporter
VIAERAAYADTLRDNPLPYSATPFPLAFLSRCRYDEMRPTPMNRIATTTHPLTRSQLAIYSLGALAMNLANLVLTEWFFERYVVGGVISTVAFSIIILAGRITDGISDPFLAYWTDNTRSHWGRRIPFLLFGTLPFAIVSFLLWIPPQGASDVFRIGYATVLAQAYFLLYGLVVTPYLALLPEIAGSSSDRLNLTTGQGVAALVGTLCFAFAGLIVQHFGFVGLGVMVGLAILISYYPIPFVIRESERAAGPKPSLKRLFQWIREVIGNTTFLPLLISTSLYWFALNLLLMLVPRWVQVQLGMEKDAVTWLMLPFIAVNLIAFFIFNWIAKRFGKYRSFLLVFALTVLVFGLVGFSDQIQIGLSQFTVAQCIVGLAGVPVGGFGVLAFALLADVIDEDSNRRGLHREAIFFGVQAIFQKSMIGLSAVAFGWLQTFGSSQSFHGCAFLAAAICLAGLFAFARFPIRK